MLIDSCGLVPTSKSVCTPGTKTKLEDEDFEPLPADEVERFRSDCMRLGYLSQDRPDLLFSSKEIARGMSSPEKRHQPALKRACRYLLRAREVAWVFQKQRWPGLVKAWSDSDWAGCQVTRRSSTGCSVTFGSHTWLCTSTTQTAISLSSGERTVRIGEDSFPRHRHVALG